MSEPETDYSLASEMFDPPSAELEDYESEDYDLDETEDYETTGYEDEDLGYYDEGQPPDLYERVAEGLAQREDPYLAGLKARQQADEWWANWQAERDYAAHVDEQQRYGEAHEEAQKLIQAAAAKHDVPQSTADETVERVANWLLSEAQAAAFDTGDQERLAWLQSAAGAREAIDAAGRYAWIRAVSEVGTGVGVDRIPDTAYSAKMRNAFDDYERGR